MSHLYSHTVVDGRGGVLFYLDLNGVLFESRLSVVLKEQEGIDPTRFRLG